MTHIISIDASPKQLSKLRNGHSVRIKKGMGFNVVVHPETYHLVSRAFAKNKGVEIALSPEEIQANRSLSPEQHVALKETQPEMAGQGIFGKKFDRFLKKAGIKDVAYKVGDALKPLAKAGITAGLTAGATALGGIQPELIPFLPAGVAGVSGMAYDYLDNPSKYQRGFSGIKGTPVRSLAEQAIKAGVNSKLNEHLGTNYDYMSRAGLESAALATINAKLNDEAIKARQSISPIEHEAIYGYGLIGKHGMRRMEGGSIGRGGGMVAHIPPALVSQPLGANFQMSHFLPPQYQRFNSGRGLYAGGGLYT